MSSKNEFWEEDSEKELQDAYKKFKLTEAADLWDDIERNLAPKRPKRRAAVKKWAALAAAVLVLAVLVPVLGNSGKNETEHNFDVAGEAENESAAAKEGQQADGGMQEDSKIDPGTADAKMDSKEDTAEDTYKVLEDKEKTVGESSAEKAPENTALQLEIKVLESGTADETGTVSAEVILDESGNFQAGEIISLNYDAGTIPEKELTGVLRVCVERTEKKIKIIEIIP